MKPAKIPAKAPLSVPKIHGDVVNLPYQAQTADMQMFPSVD